MKTYSGLDLHLRTYIHTRNGCVGASPAKSAATPRAQREWLRDEHSWTAAQSTGESFTYLFQEPHTPDNIVDKMFQKAIRQDNHTTQTLRQKYIIEAQNAVNYLRGLPVTATKTKPFTGELSHDRRANEIGRLRMAMQSDQDILGEEYSPEKLETIIEQFDHGVRAHGSQ